MIEGDKRTQQYPQHGSVFSSYAHTQTPARHGPGKTVFACSYSCRSFVVSKLLVDIFRIAPIYTTYLRVSSLQCARRNGQETIAEVSNVEETAPSRRTTSKLSRVARERIPVPKILKVRVDAKGKHESKGDVQSSIAKAPEESTHQVRFHYLQPQAKLQKSIAQRVNPVKLYS